jgi:pimeloyl-ACP methyl ester carboxylesterase
MKSMNRHLGVIPAIVILLAGVFAGLAAPETKNAPLPTGVKSHFATFGTNKVHYVTAGKGAKTLVFVHGWAGNAGFWRAQAPVLAGNANVVLIDLPGHGKSDKPQTAYTMDFFADAVVAVMRDARVNKATLIGHSMGVAVICRAYAKAPEMITGLVAVDGLLRRPDFTPEQAEKFIGPFRGAGYREHTTNFIHSMFKNPGTEALRDKVLADVLATPQYVMSSAMEGMFGENQPNWDLKRVEVPVIVINAPNPRWTPEYEAYAKGLSPKSEYRVIPDTGHVLTLEKPAEFNRVLIELLEKHALIDGGK